MRKNSEAGVPATRVLYSTNAQSNGGNPVLRLHPLNPRLQQSLPSLRLHIAPVCFHRW